MLAMTIITVANKTISELNQWQQRPLEKFYRLTGCHSI
ncbi:hypothetical protein AC26_2300 [Escherichia coli 1-176-05_S3_C2]|nr:hypothetical protein AC26_2300 [Escherichia coli 1-176-05_S3_C2]